MTHHAFPAPHKGHGCQGPDKDSVGRGAPKGQTLEKRQWTCQECSNGIRDRDLEEQLLVRKDIWQDLQEDSRAGDPEASSWNFHRTAVNE
jgi:hypothetical protein